MSNIGLNARPRFIWGMAAVMMVFPQLGLGQEDRDMGYFPGVEGIPENICADVTGNTPLGVSYHDDTASPAGQLDGAFDLVGADENPRPQRVRPTLGIQKTTNIFGGFGGNLYYNGKLIPWSNSWLFCLTSHSIHLNYVDDSKPYLRIVPIEESLGDDGFYERFRVDDLWHADPTGDQFTRDSQVWVQARP